MRINITGKNFEVKITKPWSYYGKRINVTHRPRDRDNTDWRSYDDLWLEKEISIYLFKYHYQLLRWKKYKDIKGIEKLYPKPEGGDYMGKSTKKSGKGGGRKCGAVK